MNGFFEHNKDSIRFGYRCFDRILLNGLIQPFQQSERVVGFFNSYRQVYPVSCDVLRGAAEQFQSWVKEQADKWHAAIVEAPKSRRDEFVEPYFRGRQPRSGRRRPRAFLAASAATVTMAGAKTAAADALPLGPLPEMRYPASASKAPIRNSSAPTFRHLPALPASSGLPRGSAGPRVQPSSARAIICSSATSPTTG